MVIVKDEGFIPRHSSSNRRDLRDRSQPELLSRARERGSPPNCVLHPFGTAWAAVGGSIGFAVGPSQIGDGRAAAASPFAFM